MQAECWIVTDGARGNEKQCQALAWYVAQHLAGTSALTTSGNNAAPRQFRIALKQPWGALSPRLLWSSRLALKPAANANMEAWSDNRESLLNGPYPRLLIGCGRRAALVSRMLGQRCRTPLTRVQILNPRITPAAFDWVICPRHDQLSGPNVLSTEGALHHVDDEQLRRGRSQWPELAELPSPRIGVLIGASNGAFTIDQHYLGRLLEGAARLADDGSLLVTTSRRTPPTLIRFVRQWLTQHFSARHLLHADEPGSANPYLGILAWADRLAVSSDSVNMISEALGTGRPVHSPQVNTNNQRFSRFQQGLIDSGRLLGLDNRQSTPYPPLRETEQIAGTIAAKLLESRPRSTAEPGSL